MKLNELLEVLEDMRNELGGDIEVRLATQRNYPMENTLLGATNSLIMEAVADNEEVELDEDGEPIVYLVEGDQIGYSSDLPWRAVEWRPS